MLAYKYHIYVDIHSLSFVFRPLWCAAVFSPAAAVSAAAVSAVGSAKLQKARISSILTLKTSRQRSENMMKVRELCFKKTNKKKLQSLENHMLHCLVVSLTSDARVS